MSAVLLAVPLLTGCPGTEPPEDKENPEVSAEPREPPVTLREKLINTAKALKLMVEGFGRDQEFIQEMQDGKTPALVPDPAATPPLAQDSPPASD